MRIADKIANKILEEIEDARKNKPFTQKEYLELGCLVSDVLREELNKWLSFDVDLNKDLLP